MINIINSFGKWLRVAFLRTPPVTTGFMVNIAGDSKKEKRHRGVALLHI
jgi:hypothetical protein